MTREFNTFEKSFEHRTSSAHITTVRHTKKGLSSLFKGISAVYTKAVKTKREISAGFVSITEILADKTAREGLFGEDKGKNYCGTDTDYIA